MNEIVLLDQTKVIQFKLRAFRYEVQGDKVCKRSYSLPFLKCLAPREADYALKEIHVRI